MEYKAPRGTRDILPDEMHLWHKVEDIVRLVCERAGYGEIRTPIFEYTELFERGIGQVTDIVEKEMYTFLDKAKRSITLRPEGTASVVRAFLEHKLYARPQPTKFYYIGPMFRYERPQSGRYRQFWQFGVEALGSQDPAMDVEVIGILIEIYRQLGLGGFEVQLNTIGCPECRPRYRDELRSYLGGRAGELCEDCRRRLVRNPLRLLDCKEPGCQRAIDEVPPIFEYLCDECREHFEGVKALLSALGVSFVINPRIVRGLDYYTKTVFEVVHSELGAQDVLGAGGRYDGLAGECGGPPTPGVGFAAGIDRAIQVLSAGAGAGEAGDAESRPGDAGAPGPDVYIAPIGREAKAEALKLAFALRQGAGEETPGAGGLKVETDFMGRSLKAQMKYANKLGARQVVILGDEELHRGVALLRDMSTGDQEEVPITDIVKRLSTFGRAEAATVQEATGCR
ncbi:MAG TPA: histidine--tRNA ligase [Firmicutes bacterium]|nr:histidine--tRNA ligase [Bacillota bacterium]